MREQQVDDGAVAGVLVLSMDVQGRLICTWFCPHSPETEGELINGPLHRCRCWQISRAGLERGEG